jgi:hypothetical protein
MAAATLTPLPWALVCAFGCAALPAQAAQVPPAYVLAAQRAGVPAPVLYAVALQESGTRLNRRHVPWPWTLNVAGMPLRYPTRSAACAGLRAALGSVPARRIDVGLGQINLGYHGGRVPHPCALLDPQQNLAIAADILRGHFTGEGWMRAVGRYHRPAGGEAAQRYQQDVRRHLRRISGTQP